MSESCDTCGEDQTPPAPPCACRPCVREGCGEWVTEDDVISTGLRDPWCPQHECEIVYYMTDLLLPSGVVLKALPYEASKALVNATR